MSNNINSQGYFFRVRFYLFYNDISLQFDTYEISNWEIHSPWWILIIPKYLSHNIFIWNVFWHATCMKPWNLNGWLHICVNNKKYVWSYLWCFPESIILLVLLIWLWQNWFLRIRCATYRSNLMSAYDGLRYVTVYVSPLLSRKHFHCNIEVLISN